MKVVIRDGLNETETVSTPFTVAGKVPVVIIDAPASLDLGAGSQTLVTGVATDVEDGWLGANLAWSSSLDGTLGNGDEVLLSTETLSPGVHTITASVTDTDSQVGTASFELRVDVPDVPSNPPVVVDDTAQTIGVAPAVIDVLANDSDPDGDLDPATLRIVTQPSDGNANVAGTPPLVTFEADVGFSGPTSFIYEICDTALNCRLGTVVVTVDPEPGTPPLVVDDSTDTEVDEPVAVAVLDNDSDLDGDLDETSLTIVVAPGSGTATVDAGFDVLYTPNSGFVGTDTFSYQVCDLAGNCSQGDVDIEVFDPSTTCTILGTPGDDVLVGTSGDDIICSLGGNDVIRGMGGNDVLRGGSGADIIRGGDGDDLIYGGRGADEIYGGRGADEIHGKRGDDVIFAGRGHDVVYGDRGNDTIRTGSGNDIVYGGEGDDEIRGRKGSDELDGGPGADLIIGGRGSDVIRGGSGPDVLKGRRGADDIRGGSGNDVLRGGAGQDVLRGGSGEDVAYGGRGYDVCRAETRYSCP